MSLTSDPASRPDRPHRPHRSGPLALPLHGGDRRGPPRHRGRACSRPTSPSGSSRSAPRSSALIKMMISPVIFCTIVLGVGSVRQRRPRRQGRRPGARLLPGDVHRRADHRPGGRATSCTPAPACTLTADVAKAGADAGRARAEARRTSCSGIDPDHPGLGADRGAGAADAAGRAARRLRRAGHGRDRQAGPPRHRAHPARGVPGAGDDHVGRPGRRVRRDRRGRRRDRRRRAEEPGHR